MAEGILKEKLSRLNIPAEVDSCGFESFHAGDPPDSRAIAISKTYGVDISRHRARLFTQMDIAHYTHIFVMDDTHYRKIKNMVSEKSDLMKVDYVMNAVYPESNLPVPDPWYDDLNAFKDVFQMLDNACEGIIKLNFPQNVL